MIMWILALALVAVTAYVGYRQGAIRAAISFIGLLLGAILALPLAGVFEFPFRFIHVHPIVPKFLSPLIAFLVVAFVFKALAAFVHRKADYHYRYNVPDAHRAFWERLNQRVGACVGVLNGVVYFFVLSLLIAVAGYSLVQIGGAESGSKVLSAVAKAAEDLQSTKMDKVVAPFNPAPPKYFQTSDILGLLYHNRPLVDRAENYPVFAAMADRPMFQAMGSDAEVQQVVHSPSTLEELLANPKIHEAITNAELYTEFTSVDMADLRTYLETGASPKFATERILGRWGYDLASTLNLNKALKPDVVFSTWVRLRAELTERFNGTVFTAFYNNKAALKLSPRLEGKGTPFLPGLRLPNGQTNMIAKWLTTNASYSALGKWSGAAPDYLVTLGNKNGTATSEAKLENNRLSFQFEEKALSFVKLPD